jgi:hypothetical protein
MRTHLGFRSDAFPRESGEEEALNPGRWGAALARFLRQELSNRGPLGREPLVEDWGYCIPIDNPAFDLWVGCGNYEEYPDGFLCFIEPKTPFVRKIFRKIDVRATVEEVGVALGTILRAHPDVHDLRWWPEGRA